MNQTHFDTDFEGNRISINTQITGQFKTNQSIYLNGKIRGLVESDRCIVITPNAIVEGDVHCDELYIEGTITGNAHVAHQTTMGAKAIIEGGLITDSLVITPGATIKKGLKLQKATTPKS